MKQIKSIFFLTTILFFLTANQMFAIPGVNHYIKDISGEYVYYQDTTFTKPSYVGFLYYDDNTYAARFYSPAKDSEAPIEVYILFTIDPNQEKLTFTGEKVIAEVEGDSTLINYLHDLCYDLTIRRQRAGDIGKNTDFLMKENYDLFGGSVNMKYNSLIPIFNLKTILNDLGDEQFKILTTGRLTSSADNSFEEFKGFPKELKDKKRKTPKVNKKTNEITFTVNSKQSLQLDSSWKQSLENMWLQGDSAILTMNEFEIENSSIDASDILIRQIMESTENSYIDWNNTELSKIYDENKSPIGYNVKAVYYQPKAGNVTRDTKILTKTSENTFAFFSLTVFDSIYNKKAKYYDKIIGSYKLETIEK
ncbi:MAG: hypothetical protein K6F69_11335 [Treponema sp.]|nr:hypothetical protein [Treponema sp.]